jgi:hypothetical protein
MTLYILTDGEEGRLYRVERPRISEDDKTHLQQTRGVAAAERRRMLRGSLV